MTPELENREEPKSSKKTVAVDFDNTIAAMGPDKSIGEPLPGAIEFLKKIEEMGWKTVIYSSRPVFPGGKEEIEAWLLKHDLPAYKVWTKPLAHYYVDDRAVAFKGNWDEVSTEILGGATENTADNIAKGKYSYYEIADKFGVDKDQFAEDIGRLFETDSEQWDRVVSSVGEKYSIFVDKDKFLKSANSDLAVREAVSCAYSGFASSRLYPGEHVCLSINERYGNIARVVSVGESGYSLHDLNTSEDIEIPEQYSGLAKKIILGSVPADAFKPSCGIAVAANSLYPDGLAYRDIRNWYDRHSDQLNTYISGRPVRGYYQLKHKLVSPIGPFSRVMSQFDASIINEPLMGFGYCTRPDSELYAIKFSPAQGSSLPSCTSDVVISILSALSARNAQLMFDGSDGLVLIIQTEPSADNFDEIARNCVSDIVSDMQEPSVMCAAMPPAGGLNIQPGHNDNGAVLVPYTVNQDTGLSCVPVDVEDIEEFDPMCAKIL